MGRPRSPRSQKSRAKLLKWLSALAAVLAVGGVAFGYFVVLPHALAFLTNFDSSQLNYTLQAKPYLSFCIHVLAAMLVVFELPVFMLGPTPTRHPHHREAAQEPTHGLLHLRVVGMAVAPSVDPVTTTLQALPLFILYEGSILLCAFLDRRDAAISSARPGDVRQAVSAGWVLPVDGPPLETPTSPGRTGGSSRSAAGRAERHYAGAIILPGSSTPTPISSTRSMPASATARRSAPGCDPHRAKRALDPDGDARDRPPGRRRLARSRDHDHRRLQLLRRRRDGRDRARPARDRLPRGVRPRPRRGRARFGELRARVAETELVRIGISPHAPYTCSLEVYHWCLSLGIPVGTHLAESAARTSGSSMARARSGRRDSWSRRRAASVATLAAVLGPELLRAHCVDARRRRDRAARRADVPVAHCPARTRCSAVASRRSPRCAPPASGSGSAPTRRPRCPRSTPGTSSGRRSRARARERRPDALDAADALGSRPLGAARALGLDARVGTLTPGKRADLTVVSPGRKPVRPGRRSRRRRRLRRLARRVSGDHRRRTHPLPSRRDRVARGTQHRKRRPRTNARVAAAPRAVSAASAPA